jgi:hypothetical protein
MVIPAGGGTIAAGSSGSTPSRRSSYVEVDGSAFLVFGCFAVGEPHSGEPASFGELVEVAFHGLFGAPPQFAGVVVPHHVAVVVVAVEAERLPELLVAGCVAGEAGDGDAVRAGVGGCGAACVARGWFAGAAGLVGAVVGFDVPGVHLAEGGCGEGGEHRRMSRDRCGDAVAADESGFDDLVGVAAVDLGARGADGAAPVAARFVDHPVR